MNPKNTPNQFRSVKELAAQYKIDPRTLKKEVGKIKGIAKIPNRRFFSIVELKIIYNHLGNPFE